MEIFNYKTTYFKLFPLKKNLKYKLFRINADIIIFEKMAYLLGKKISHNYIVKLICNFFISGINISPDPLT